MHPGAIFGRQKGCSNFLRHEIYKNSVSSVGAWIKGGATGGHGGFSARIFMARLHTTAIFCSCHVLGSTSTLIFISAIDVRPSLNVHSILVLSSWWVFLTSFTFNEDHTQRSLIHFQFIGVIQMNLKGHSTQN